MNQTINATMMLAGLAAAGALPASQARAAEPPPVEYFMRHAAYSDALISPDGRHLAISVDRGDQDVLTVLRMSDLSIVKVNVLPDEKSVAGFRWISDDRLMFTAIRKVGGFARSTPTAASPRRSSSTARAAPPNAARRSAWRPSACSTRCSIRRGRC